MNNTITIRIALLFTLLLGGLQMACAQQPAFGFSREVLSSMEYKLNQHSSNEHSTIQPAAYGLEKSWFALKDSSYQKKQATNEMTLSAFAGLSGGGQFGKSSRGIADMTAGALMNVHYKERLNINLGYIFSMASPAAYMQRYIDSLRIIPGQGYAVKEGQNLYHAHYPYASIGYQAGKYFHFELGNGKNFWGDGYRSLILSDNSNPYPYFRITTKIWKIKYTNLYAQLRDISTGQTYFNARKKYIAMHALSWNINEKWNFTAYEMVIWQDRDSLSRRNLDMNYLNPLVFYRPVEYAQGSAENVLIGGSLKWKFSNKIQFYTQFVIDEFLLKEVKSRSGWWANKCGGQFGVKVFDMGIRGLHFQSEVNAVRPFTYSHGSAVQAWGNMNQPLAHPMGSNFYEWINMFRYDYKKWSFREKIIVAQFGRDKDADGNGTIDNLGGNIFRSYANPFSPFGNKTGQGNTSHLTFQELTISRRFEKLQSIELFITHTMRLENNDKLSTDHFVMAGIRLPGFLTPTRDF